MTRADRMVIGSIAVIALLAWPVLAIASAGVGQSVEISSPGGTTVVPISEDGRLTVEGASGPVEVEISDGTVRVAESGCPDQICVHTGAVSHAGATIACVPNRVVIRIRGGEVDGLDARVR